MFVFNTTYNVHNSVEVHWLKYVKTQLIPDMLDDGFLFPVLMKIHFQQEPEVQNYALQFRAPSREFVENWMTEKQADYNAEMYRLYKEKALFFTTIMEEM